MSPATVAPHSSPLLPSTVNKATTVHTPPPRRCIHPSILVNFLRRLPDSLLWKRQFLCGAGVAAVVASVVRPARLPWGAGSATRGCAPKAASQATSFDSLCVCIVLTKNVHAFSSCRIIWGGPNNLSRVCVCDNPVLPLFLPHSPCFHVAVSLFPFHSSRLRASSVQFSARRAQKRCFPLLC